MTFEDDLYDQFPRGELTGFGIAEGFNTWICVNEASLFRPEVLERNPVIRAFVEAPFRVTYALFKSSQRETEYLIHKPHFAMTGHVDGIENNVPGVSLDDPRTPITTLVLHHERTLAYHPTHTIVVSGDGPAGMLIVKQQPT